MPSHLPSSPFPDRFLWWQRSASLENHYLPYAITLFDLIIETGMCTAAQIEAHVLTNDNGISLDNGLVTIEGHYWRANEVLGTQIRLAHSHRAIDKIASQTLKPC